MFRVLRLKAVDELGVRVLQEHIAAQEIEIVHGHAACATEQVFKVLMVRLYEVAGEGEEVRARRHGNFLSKEPACRPRREAASGDLRRECNLAGHASDPRLTTVPAGEQA